MSRALLILNSTEARAKARLWIDRAPIGTRVEYKAPKRTLPQNDYLWGLLTDVSTQATLNGVKLTSEDWKVVFLSALKQEVRLVPNLDGTGFVQLGRSSSDLSKEEMATLLELIVAYGDKNGVRFSCAPLEG